MCHYWILILSLGLGISSPIVSKVSPTQIGLGGGAVTIEGAGFSEDVFNQFDPVLGNKVTTFKRFLLFYLTYFFRFGSPMSLSLCLARIPSTGTSCWRTHRIPQPRGSCVISRPGRAPRAQTGSVSSSRLMGWTSLTTLQFATGTDTLH